jgi:hypothetical protein
MLQVETPFPNPGSRGLLIEGAQAHPVRVMQHLPGRARGKNRLVTVSLLDRQGVASGTRRVKIADLENAQALDDAEKAELVALERKLAGKAVDERSQDYRRYMVLFHRNDHAERAAELERLKGRVPSTFHNRTFSR